MLEIKNLKKSYDRILFEHLNIKFPSSGFVLIRGQNGSGKTTLFRIISGLDNFDEGQIIYNKEILLSQSDFEKFRLRHVAYIFQDFGLIDHFSVKQNLMYPFLFENSNNENLLFKEALQKVNLNLDLNSSCVNLSGGEKQRLAIARSLLKEKNIYLCDEPTASLDLENAKDILVLLKNISKDHLVLCISHDEKVDLYADYIFDFGKKKFTKISNVNFSERVLNISNKKSIPFRKRISLSIASLLKQKNRSILSIFSILLVVISFFMTITLSSSIKENLTSSVTNYLNYNMFRVSELSSSAVNKGSFSFVKEYKPNEDKLNSILEGKEYALTCNFESFLNKGQFLYSNGKEIAETISFQPINYLEKTKFKDYHSSIKLMKYNDVFLNNAAKELFKNNIIFNLHTRIQTVDENFNRARDEVSLKWNINFYGYIDEFAFMEIPTIYYSYTAVKIFLSDAKLLNASKLLKEEVSIYDRLSILSSNDDELSSYSFCLWTNDENVLFLKDLLEKNGYNVTSNPLSVASNVTSILSLCQTSLIIFTIMSTIIMFLLIGIVMFSMIVDRKKEIALLSIHGIPFKNIITIFEMDQIVLTIIAILIALSTFPLILQITNNLVYQYLSIFDFLVMPSNSMIFFIGFLIVLAGVLISNVVLIVLKKSQLNELLKEE